MVLMGASSMVGPGPITAPATRLLNQLLIIAPPDVAFIGERTAMMFYYVSPQIMLF